MKRLLALLTLALFLASPASAGLDPTKNFAKATLSTGYTSAATSIVLMAGGGAKFAVPSNAVWWNGSDYGDPSDDPSVEIVRVTGISTDTLTVTRAQESTSAANHNTAGKVYLLVAGPTAKLTVDILTISTTGSAATLTTPRAINGVNFDGSAPITVTADANTLSGTTLKSTVVNSSLTSVGTLTGLTVTAAPTFSALTAGYLSNAGTAGLMTNSPVYTDGTNVGIGPTAPVAHVHISAAATSAPSITAQTGLFRLSVTGTVGFNMGVGPSPYYTWLQTTNEPASGPYVTALALNPLGGNVGIGAIAFGTSANSVLGIGNGTAPSTSPANMIQVWAEDVSASSELRVRDEAGNVTTLSPHNFSMFTPGAAQAFPWSYYSRNAFIGKEVNVDLMGAIAALETLTGKKFIYVADLPPGEIEDWTAQEAAKKVHVEKARLDKALEKEVEVVAEDAVEVVSVTEERPSATLMMSVTRFGLNAVSGILESVVETRPKTETFDTGKTEFRLKSGVRLDEATGKFWRHVRADEVVVEPYVPKAPPAWIADRLAKK